MARPGIYRGNFSKERVYKKRTQYGISPLIRRINKGMQTKKSMHPKKLNAYFAIKLNRVEL
jgi:hypothetical protein